MSDSDLPLVVGAGPVGLAAALFLARQGIDVRIVEARAHQSAESRALAVNPRTLDLLEPTGVTERMLALGKPIRGACFRNFRGLAGEISFANLAHRYPFLLALSQATTERLLEEALRDCGVRVDRGTKLLDCRNADPDAAGGGRGGAVEVELETASHGARSRMKCPWLMAADGAHSTVRARLGVAFEGRAFARMWHLADVPLETSLAQDRAHIFFYDEGGFVFLIRVVDVTGGITADGPLWRVIGNMEDPLGRLTARTAGAFGVGRNEASPVDVRANGPPVWTSSFRISHRINAHLSIGSVYFAGDAAHVHSPVGARGMNLGIEDAWVFARLIASGAAARYDRLRRRVDLDVVRRIELVSRVARGESAPARFVRSAVLPTALRLAPVTDRMVAMLTGLDHDLPAV